jgi:DNA-binding PadR family transcriptional regulator
MFGWRHRLGKYGLSPVQFLILLTLKKRSMYGYEIIKELRDRFGDLWEPKTGTIYPALRRLEMKGLVKTELRDEREFYTLTDEGSEALKYAAELLEGELDFVGRYHSMLPTPMRHMMMKKLFSGRRHRWRHGPMFIPPMYCEYPDREEVIDYLKEAKEALNKQIEMIEERIKELEREKGETE